MIWPGLGPVTTLKLLESQIEVVSIDQNEKIRNVGLAKLIHNATLTYRNIPEEERSAYQKEINKAKTLLDDSAVINYFSTKEDHLNRAGLKGDQARLGERFYANVRHPLDDKTIQGLLEINPFLKETFERSDGQLSLIDDVLVTILYSYVGKGEESKLLILLEKLKSRVREGFWSVLLNAYFDRDFKPLSVQTMIQVEAFLPDDSSRIAAFVRLIPEEDLYAVYECLMNYPLKRKDAFLKELIKRNIPPKKIV